MSGAINYKDVSKLLKAYQDLEAVGENAQSVLARLPQHLQERIALSGSSHTNETITSTQARLSIRDVVHKIYDCESGSVQSRIHGVFYRCCRVRGTGDNDWGRHHVKDGDKVEHLLISLELMSMEKEIFAWAGYDPHRKEAARRILDFMNNPGQIALDLSNLRLTSLPDIFDNSEMQRRLCDLSLRNNKLQTLPDSIGNLANLTKLNLTLNQLHALPDCIGNLTRLTELYLHGNQLQTIPDFIGNLTNLTKLDLSYNQLQTIPDWIGNLTSLTVLVLGENRLQTLPDCIGNLTRLTELYLPSNQLQTIPDFIGNLTNLTKLDLSHIQLQTIPDFIGNLTNLTVLYLFNTQLQTIPDWIGNLTRLTVLDLSYNRLESLPNSIVNLPTQCQVDLQNSGLSNQVLGRLRETCQQPGYSGPRFYISIHDHNYSQSPQNLDASLEALYNKAEIQGFTSFQTNYPNIRGLISNIHGFISNDSSKKASSLQGWLSRLAFMKQSGREGSSGLSRKILSYLDLAEHNGDFRERFFNTIEGASVTCGDRMALSVLHLGIQHRMTVFDKSDLRGYAEFLIHGPWMLDRLEEIAREKVQTFRFVDEIEVYLGYPVKLRERLSLQIDVEEMLYFSFSGITKVDLENAASFIESQITTPDAIANILVQREDWIQALKEQHPIRMAAFQRDKDSRLENLKEDDVSSYNEIQKQYMQNILALTKKALT